MKSEWKRKAGSAQGSVIVDGGGFANKHYRIAQLPRQWAAFGYASATVASAARAFVRPRCEQKQGLALVTFLLP